ncbi:MAG: GNAT family N-acetyltransferase [Oscillospiraceae bacterium]|nr:GNAT family N-acetyltransferase [Oscillospiraceae bacterium]
MTAVHREAVLDMMRVFYASPAVLSNGSDEIFENDIRACVTGSPWLEGYVFAEGEKLLGYAMVAKSFSTEFGKPCKWIEDLFILPDNRGKGIGSKFFAFLEEKYPESLLRLEVEEENEGAMKMYFRNGFDVLPYTQMKKNA